VTALARFSVLSAFLIACVGPPPSNPERETRDTAGLGEVIVAVLEDGAWRCDDSTPPSVRPVFVSRGGLWATVSTAPGTHSDSTSLGDWHAAKNGRELGVIVSEPLAILSDLRGTRFSTLGIEASRAPLPRSGDADQTFVGWCDRPLSQPPLILTTPTVAKPAGTWADRRDDARVTTVMLEAFRSQVPLANRCAADMATFSRFDYAVEDLRIAWRVRNEGGQELVGLQLDPRLNNCDGPPEATWGIHAFLVDGDVRHLGIGLAFIESADFDANGSREALFWYSGYNHDGYALFYNGFDSNVMYTWKYH
jgi:hypothetical protein